MQVRASVISVENDIALIRVFKNSACGGCSDCPSKNTCHTELMLSDSGKTYDCYAENPVSAKKGDIVIVESTNNIPLLFALLIFVLPVVVSIAAYVIFNEYFNSYQLLSISLLIFFFSFVLCSFTANWYSKKHTSNIISKIIEENGF